MPSMIRVTCMSLLALAASTAAAQQLPELPAAEPEGARRAARRPHRLLGRLLEPRREGAQDLGRARAVRQALAHRRQRGDEAHREPRLHVRRQDGAGRHATRSTRSPARRAGRSSSTATPTAQGNDGYDQKKDVARVTVKPEAIPAARAPDVPVLRHDRRRDAPRPRVGEARASRCRSRSTPRPGDGQHRQGRCTTRGGRTASSARYLLDNGGDLDKALALIDTRSRSRRPGGTTGCARRSSPSRAARPTRSRRASRRSSSARATEIFEGFFKAEVDEGDRATGRRSKVAEQETRLASLFDGLRRGRRARRSSTGDSADRSAIARRAVERARARPLSADVLRALEAQNARLRTERRRARRNLAALARGAAAVVTGQQVGLFLGPLYTSTRRRRRSAWRARSRSETGAPVVPRVLAADRGPRPGRDRELPRSRAASASR